MPLRLAGYGKIESLKREVYCEGINPKIIIEPLQGIVEFPKKVITSVDTISADFQSVTLSNPSSKDIIDWRIETSPLDHDKVFSLIPVSGRIGPGLSMKIKVQFKPNKSKKYDVKLPIYIDSEETPYKHLHLLAEGAAPCLLFETQDIILPTVPLFTESLSRFVIINDGYAKTYLTYSIAKNVNDVDLKVRFINSNHLNSTKNICIVELGFIARSPVSFTTKIDFEDNNKKAYSVLVSGTADNFLFTNFLPGMSRNFSMKKAEKSKMDMYGLGLIKCNLF